jgi:hypothetical protein
MRIVRMVHESLSISIDNDLVRIGKGFDDDATEGLRGAAADPRLSEGDHWRATC